jgi:hypothetical protein
MVGSFLRGSVQIRKFAVWASFLTLLFSSRAAIAADVNLDGHTNVVDAACVVEIGLGDASACGPNGALIADWNCDGTVNVQDSVAVIQVALDAMSGQISWSNGQGKFPACAEFCDASCNGYVGCVYRSCVGAGGGACVEFPLLQGSTCKLDLSCEHLAVCYDSLCRLTAIKPSPDCMVSSATCQATVDGNGVMACPAGIVYTAGSEEYATAMHAFLQGEPKGTVEYLGAVLNSVETSASPQDKWVEILDGPPDNHGFLESGHVFTSFPPVPIPSDSTQDPLGGFLVHTPLWAPQPKGTVPYTALSLCVTVVSGLVRVVGDWLTPAAVDPFVTLLFRNSSSSTQFIGVSFGEWLLTSQNSCLPDHKLAGLSILLAGCKGTACFNCSTCP